MKNMILILAVAVCATAWADPSEFPAISFMEATDDPTPVGDILYNDATGDTTVEIKNEDATYEANLLVEGDITADNFSGVNTGDQTISLTGDVNGEGTGAITTTLAPDSVGSAEVVSNSLTSGDLAADSVGASEIAGDAVGTAEIAADAVGASELAPDSVGASEISTGAVGADEVANNSLGSDDLAPSSVGPSELASNAVETQEILDEAVTFPKMQHIATDKLLGRTTAGTGEIEQITVTDFFQTLFDDADAATARATLGVGSGGGSGDAVLANNETITGNWVNTANPWAIDEGGTGAGTASGARTNLGLGTMATQGAGSVAITGGSIDGVPIGATTRSTIAGTTGNFNSTLAVTGVGTFSDDIAVNGGDITSNAAQFNITGTGATSVTIKHSRAGSTTFDFDAAPTDGTSSSLIRFLRNASTTGSRQIIFFKGDGTNVQVLNLNTGTGALTLTGSQTISSTLAVTGTITAGSGAHVLTNSTGLIDGAKVQAATVPATAISGASSTSGHVLTSTGTGTAPTWQAASGGGVKWKTWLPVTQSGGTAGAPTNTGFSSNAVYITTSAYATAVDSFRDFTVAIPAGYGGGAITFNVKWTSASSTVSQSPALRVRATAFADAELLASPGTTIGTNYPTLFGSSSSIRSDTFTGTPGGTPAAGEMLVIRVERVGTTGDDYTGNIFVHGVEIVEN